MSKSFLSGSKNRSSSSNFISLHFNKADEEQLEISYVESSDKDEDEGKIEESSPNSRSTSAAESSETAESLPRAKSDFDAANATTQKNSSTSKESTAAVKDSVVKEYWSRISKRHSTSDAVLDVPDSESLEHKEGWMLWKDLRGKLAKTIEEHKNVSKGSKEEKTPERTLKKSLTDPGDIDPDRTPTENIGEELLLNLSPAIEADEAESKSSAFDSYINSELAKAKCEIISNKPSKVSNTQFYLQQPKIANPPPNVEEPLSSQSNGDTKGNNDFIDDSQPSTSNIHSSPDQVDNVQQQQGLFHKLPLLCRKYYYFVKSYWNSVIFRILVAVLALLLVPVPSWISGFVAGAFVSGYAMYFLLKPGKPKEAFVVPDFNSMPPSNIPVTEVEDEPIIHKGWMNELPFDLIYNPETYHVNCTRSMYVRLDGSYLRVSYPQSNIPKRAMFNETRHDLQFIHQHHYDITGSSVELLPVGLARKRLWSKKYPICLRIPNPKQAVLSKLAKDMTESSTPKPPPRKESPVRRFIPRINENNEVVLYLFSRTDRDKDLWYHRFQKASRLKLLRSHSPSSNPNLAGLESSALEGKRATSMDLATLQYFSNHQEDSVDSEGEDDLDSFVDLGMTKQQKFEFYMKQLLAPLHSDPFLFSVSKEKKDEKVTANSLAWLNVLLGRVFFDFLSEDVWARLVSEKIQRKLSKIKLPVFLKELIVKDINLGTALPKIHRASDPFLDQKGLWIDIDLSYNGSFHMTLETKINLLRTRIDPEEFSLPTVSKSSDSIDQVLRSPVYNSDEEDSAESSTDEDIPLPEVHDTTDDSSLPLAGGSTGKKILRLVDRFAQSTYFQNAAKNKYIKKAMEDISNTPLILTVEVQWLTGTLALNIPPMPTDRLWYGFRTNPHLSIVARPKLGHHVVTLTHVTEWIERKLVSEFQKILVMPNMDDLIIPIMLSDTDLPKT